MVVSEIRPITLYQHVLIGNRLVDLFKETGKINPELLALERESMRKVKMPRHRRERFDESENKLSRSEMIQTLDQRGLLPAITFIFSRAACDSAVNQCVFAGLRLTNTEERKEIIRTATSLNSHLAPEDLEVLGYSQWLDALERGIAAHHAGLLPSFKETVEDLFKRGLVKAVFATETLALGINMPAKTVILEKLSKWNGESHVLITPGEYTQLTGRAGRRGIDIEGNAIVQWSPTIDSAMVAGLASTRTYPLKSSFAPTYNMAINLINRFGRERARGSLESSFAQFQADRAVVGLVRQIKKNDSAVAELMQDVNCHLGDFAEYAGMRSDIKEIERLLSKRDARRTIDQKQRRFLESEMEGLRKGLRSHPCHSCNDRESHARIAERADRIRRESAGLRARVENRTHVIAKTFDRICDVLTHLNYIESENTLEQGKILAKIYAESDLLLTEAIRRGVLDSLSPQELVAVASAVIFSSRTAENSAPKMPHNNVAQALVSIVSIWSELEEIEERFGVKTQREPDFGFAFISYKWAQGNSLQSVLKGSDMSVGYFVLSTKQIIDLLTQIAGASPALRKTCREAIARLDRGVISYMLEDL